MKSTIIKISIALFAFSIVFTSCFKDDLLREIDDLRTLVITLQQKNDSLNKVINLRADSLAKALTASQKRSDSLAVVLRTKTDSLSQALGITNTNLLNMGKSIDSIKTQLTGINTQLTQLSSQLAATNSQIAALTLQLASANADIVALNTKYQQLTTQLQTINAQIAALQAEQAKLLNQLNAILLILNPPVDITTGLVAYYPFSGNAGDSSGNNNHGTVNGATLTTDRFGTENKAYSFNGVNNYIDLGSAGVGTTNVPSTFSVSVWILTSNGMGSILSRRHSITQNWQTLAMNSSYNAVYWATDANQYVQSPYQWKTISLDEWHHVYAYKSTTNYGLYIDGVIIKEWQDNFSFTNEFGNMYVGLQSVWNAYFKGKIDDIRIYNRTLNQEKITYLATH